METPTCAACDAEISESADKCPECGNYPLRDGALQMVTFGIVFGVAGIFWPPITLLGAFLWLNAAILWGLHKLGLEFWGSYYSPAKRDWPSPS